MKRRCRQLKAVQAWSREGCRAKIPEALQRHAAACRDCAESLAEINETRAAVSRLAEPRVEQERLEAVRFAVMAGARKAGSGRTEPARRWSRWWRAALAAGVCALLAAVVVVALPGPTGEENGALADVRLAPGAVGEPLRLGPDAVFVLRYGRAEFSVPRLEAGQRYRVMVGGDVVEVRGTRFEVAASASGLQHVRVREGRVLVRLAGKVVAELGSGEEWNRPGRAQAAARQLPYGQKRRSTAKQRPLGRCVVRGAKRQGAQPQ